MEIRGHQPEFRRSERTRGAQPAGHHEAARVQAHRLENHAAAGDRVELSPEAHGVAHPESFGTAPDRLAALRELYQAGTLNTPERLQRAAAAILGQHHGPVGS
jgi:hypothetical protein